MLNKPTKTNYHFRRKPAKKLLTSKKIERTDLVLQDSTFPGPTKDGDWSYLAIKICLIYLEEKVRGF